MGKSWGNFQVMFIMLRLALVSFCLLAVSGCFQSGDDSNTLTSDGNTVTDTPDGNQNGFGTSAQNVRFNLDVGTTAVVEFGKNELSAKPFVFDNKLYAIAASSAVDSALWSIDSDNFTATRQHSLTDIALSHPDNESGPDDKIEVSHWHNTNSHMIFNVSNDKGPVFMPGLFFENTLIASEGGADSSYAVSHFDTKDWAVDPLHSLATEVNFIGEYQYFVNVDYDSFYRGPEFGPVMQRSLVSSAEEPIPAFQLLYNDGWRVSSLTTAGDKLLIVAILKSDDKLQAKLWSYVDGTLAEMADLTGVVSDGPLLQRAMIWRDRLFIQREFFDDVPLLVDIDLNSNAVHLNSSLMVDDVRWLGAHANYLLFRTNDTRRVVAEDLVFYAYDLVNKTNVVLARYEVDPDATLSENQRRANIISNSFQSFAVNDELYFLAVDSALAFDNSETSNDIETIPLKWQKLVGEDIQSVAGIQADYVAGEQKFLYLFDVDGIISFSVPVDGSESIYNQLKSFDLSGNEVTSPAPSLVYNDFLGVVNDVVVFNNKDVDENQMILLKIK